MYAILVDVIDNKRHQSLYMCWLSGEWRRLSGPLIHSLERRGRKRFSYVMCIVKPCIKWYWKRLPNTIWSFVTNKMMWEKTYFVLGAAESSCCFTCFVLKISYLSASFLDIMIWNKEELIVLKIITNNLSSGTAFQSPLLCVVLCTLHFFFSLNFHLWTYHVIGWVPPSLVLVYGWPFISTSWTRVMYGTLFSVRSSIVFGKGQQGRLHQNQS